MVEEIFMLEVKSGTEKEFEHAFAQAMEIMGASKGYHGAELKHCMEQKNKYLVSVTWNAVEAHERFKNTPEFEEMKNMLAPFYSSVPHVQHYEKVI